MRVKTITFSNAELSAATGTTKPAYIEFTERDVPAGADRTLRLYGNRVKVTNKTGAEISVAVIGNESESKDFTASSTTFGRTLVSNGEIFTIEGRALEINALKESGTVSADLRIDVLNCSERKEV